MLGVGVYRNLPLSAKLGEKYTVTLTIDVNESNKPRYYILYEPIPKGFEVVDDGGMRYSKSKRTLRFIAFNFPRHRFPMQDMNINYTLEYKTQHTDTFTGQVRYSGKSHIVLGDDNITLSVGPCVPNWILNNIWSACISNIQYRNYYDINNCNKTELRRLDVSRVCGIYYPAIEVHRTLPQSASIGEEFTATLTIDVDESNKPKVYILYETIPMGFEVIDTEGMQYKHSTRTLKLMAYESSYFNTRIEDRTITYRLRPNAYPTDAFNGNVRYSQKKESILGDTGVSLLPK